MADKTGKKLELHEAASEDSPRVDSGLPAPPTISVGDSASDVVSGKKEKRMGGQDIYIGRTFGGRYTVESKIGRGGMGHVYLAEQIGLGRKVVVKVLVHDPQSEHSNSSERFVREAQTLSMLNHPNVVGVHDFGQNDEESYIVMEYVDGIRLDTLIKRSGQLGLEEFVLIARQMLDALGEAHEVGIIHRDLKPSNVMLTTRKGVPYYVKVLDFGLAKLMEEESDLTGKHSLVGSLSYLAPEQILGEECDQRVDIYALGVLFYFMLAGRKPFLGRDTRVLYQHIHEEAEPLSEALPAGHGIPQELLDLVHLCLSKDASARPEDANVLLSMLLDIFDPSFLNTMVSPNEFSGPSLSGIRRPPVGIEFSSEASNESRNLIRAPQQTGQTAAVSMEQSSPSHSSSNRALIIEDDSIDEESLPLLEINVAAPGSEKKKSSAGLIAIAAVLFLGLGALGAYVVAGQGAAGEKTAPGTLTAAGAVDGAPEASKEPVVAAQEDKPEQAASATTGHITIKSSPAGAMVLVGGDKKGTTPLEIDLPAGSHEIAIVADGHVREEGTIDVAAGEENEVAYKLVASDSRTEETSRVAKKPPATSKRVKKKAEPKKTTKRTASKKDTTEKGEAKAPAETAEKKPVEAKKTKPVESFDDGVKLLDDGTNKKTKKKSEFELLDVQ